MPKAKIYHVNPACNKWEEDNHMKHMQRRINAAKSTVPTARKGGAATAASPAGGGCKQPGALSSRGTSDVQTRPVQPAAIQQIAAGSQMTTNSNIQLPEGIDMKQLDALIIHRLQQVLAGVPLEQFCQQAKSLQAAAPPAVASKPPSKQAPPPAVCVSKRPPMPKPCKPGAPSKKHKGKQQQGHKPVKKERPPWQEDWAAPGPPTPLCAGAFPVPKKDENGKQRTSAPGTHTSSPKASQKSSAVASTPKNALPRVQLLSCSPGPSRPVSCSRYTSPTAENAQIPGTGNAAQQTTSMLSNQAASGHRVGLQDARGHVYNDMLGGNIESACLSRILNAAAHSDVMNSKGAPSNNRPSISHPNSASSASSGKTTSQQDACLQAQHGHALPADEYESDEFEVYDDDDDDEELIIDGGAAYLAAGDHGVGAEDGMEQHGYSSQLGVAHASQLRQSMAELTALVQHKIQAVRQSHAQKAVLDPLPGHEDELGEDETDSGSNDLIGTLGLLGLDSWTGSTCQLWGQCLLGASELQYIEQQSHKGRSSSEPEFHTGDLPAWMNEQQEGEEEDQEGDSHDSWRNTACIEAGPPAGQDYDMHGPDASHADDSPYHGAPHQHLATPLQHAGDVGHQGMDSVVWYKAADKLACMPGGDGENVDGDDAVLFGTCPDTAPDTTSGMQAEIIASAAAAAQALGLTAPKPPLPKPPLIATLFPPPPGLQSEANAQLVTQHRPRLCVDNVGDAGCNGVADQRDSDHQGDHAFLSQTSRQPMMQAAGQQDGQDELRSHRSADAQLEGVTELKDGLAQQATALWDSLRQLHQLMTGPKAHELSPMGKAQRAASAGSVQSGFTSVSSAASPSCTTPTPASNNVPSAATGSKSNSNTNLPAVCL